MSVKEKAHYTLPAATLASWIESQPENWWIVDGDPVLTSRLSLPCPSDELAPAIRKVGKDLLLYDKTPASRAHGEAIAGDRLDELADIANRRHKRIFLLNWADSDVDWLLIDDEGLD